MYYKGPSMSLFNQTVRPMKFKQSANQIYARIINMAKRKMRFKKFVGRAIDCFRLIGNERRKDLRSFFHNNNKIVFALNRKKFHIKLQPPLPLPFYLTLINFIIMAPITWLEDGISTCWGVKSRESNPVPSDHDIPRLLEFDLHDAGTSEKLKPELCLLSVWLK